MTTATSPGRAIIGALALCLALAGCSTLKLGYNNLPELSYWWLDGYMDFSDEQAPRVREELARIHHWHRHAELPRLSGTLQALEKLAPEPISPAQACTVVAGLRERLAAVQERAEPALARVAGSLTPAQLAHLARKHERNNRDFRRKWIRVSIEKRLERRLEQLEENAERLYGRLGPQQQAVLREHVSRSRFDPALLLAERERRQADALQTLRQVQAPGLPPAQAQALLRGWMDRLQASPDPSWQAHQKVLLEENCAIAAGLHNAAGPAQRARAIERLQGWQRDLGELAARP